VHRIVTIILLLIGEHVVAADTLQTVLGGVTIRGNTIISVSECESILNAEAGRQYDASKIEAGIKRIVQRYADEGYPFAVMNITDVRFSHDTIYLQMEIIEGSRARIGEMIIEGLRSTDTSIVTRELLRSDYYSRRDIEGAIRRLRRLNIFNEISEPVIEPSAAERVRLRLGMSEKPSTSADGALSYGSDGNGGSQLAGYAEIAFMNIAGTARKASLYYRRDAPTTDNLQLDYTEPWVFSVPVTAGISFSQSSRDSTYTRTAVVLSAETDMSQSSAVRISAGYQSYLPGKAGNMYRTSQLNTGITATVDTRDQPARPTVGTVVSLGGYYTTKRLSGTVANDTQRAAASSISTLILHAEHYIPTFTDRLILAFHTDMFANTASGKLQYSDLRHIGGLTTLRGYFEGEHQASEYVIGTIEYRLFFVDASFTSIFVDMGYFERKRTIAMTDETGFLASWGIGLALDTRIGILKAAAALPKGEPIERAKLHFGYTAAF
jgi:outer membrane protein assembly factor BamA